MKMKLTKEQETEKLKATNLELQELVGKLTVELDNKNRELEIESSLERIRSHAMSMRDSGDLSVAAGIVFSELKKLGIHPFRSGVGLLTEEPHKALLYAAMEGPDYDALVLVGPIDLSAHKCMALQYESCLKQENYFPVLTGKEFQSYIAALADQIPIPSLAESQFRQTHYGYYFPFKEGYFYTWTETPYTTTEISLLERFKAIIALTFRRYLDLQKAEAQAREATIETALERVRSKSMAMHSSNELKDVITIVIEQFRHLGFDLDLANFNYLSTPKEWMMWLATPDYTYPELLKIPAFDHPLFNRPVETVMKGLSFMSDTLTQDEFRTAWQHFYNTSPALNEYDSAERKDYIAGCAGFARSIVFMKQIALTISNFKGVPYTEEQNTILRRFANVFEQTYTRFLDLQKAEAQAKEARTEAALEKVRSRALAMHRSEELQEVVTAVFDRLKDLDIETDAINLDVFNDDLKNAYLWTAVPGHNYSQEFRIPYNDTVVFRDIYEGLVAGKDLHSKVYNRQEKDEFLAFIFEHTDFKHIPEERKAMLFATEASTVSVAYAKHIAIIAQRYREKIFSNEENEILVRFAKVFEQAYVRFLDLKKAEAQAKEAQIEASLERVRSKAMGMHSSQDLADTIVAFYHELENFSITPRRCGVGLLNKGTRIAELSTMNTTELGKTIEIIGTVKMAGHPVLDGVYENWLLQKEYHPVLRGAEIPAYYQLLRPQIAFPDYPNDAVQYGYFFYFPEGGVYAWTEKEMAEEELKIYRRFTSVLSLTYKRYKDLQQAEELAKQAAEDLIKLKEEKKRTEDAMAELKNTQSQLVQSEKMASLGELTAGIAHEIQNPLNFVNNFSDVSTELLDEMMDEVAKGNYDEVKSIVGDIKQNLEKINHHGKRADGIVKGMLQHSRSSSGQKEFTDINELADEYLRLAFHGLRAKDKSFNAAFKTDFDNSIGKVEIIPQDIGRVLVNLINNAFYAVNERRKGEVNGYEPVVTVSTHKTGNGIEICVKDNGNGIPKEALDKIFQPFFTTKPTGQGTGLGLSLSYDIIKAHGGEIRVNSGEEEGTTFSILLPP